MKVKVNDDTLELPAESSVANLLSRLNYHDTRGLAVAVNDAVYPRSGWPQQILYEGSRRWLNLALPLTALLRPSIAAAGG